MIDTQSPAFIAACEAFQAASFGQSGSLVHSLADAIEAYEKAQWQPIETARKQTGNFLVWDAHYGRRIGRVHNRPDHDDWLSYCDGHNRSSKGGIRATHWRPLPTPPEEV